MTKIKTNKEELLVNFQNDLIISKYGIDINNNQNEENKNTYVMNARVYMKPIKKWRIRNIKTNLKRTYKLIKYYWRH